MLDLLQFRLTTIPATASLSAVLHAVQKDYAAFGVNPELQNVASTVVGARLIGNIATIFNVGDSRAYLLTNGVEDCLVRLLSRDHTILGDKVGAGEISPDEARSAASFLKGLSCQFIVDAKFDEFNVNIATHELQPGERLLLCSDGLNEVLSDVEIAALLINNSHDDPLNACKATRRAGDTDEFSVIVLALEDRGCSAGLAASRFDALITTIKLLILRRRSCPCCLNTSTPSLARSSAVLCMSSFTPWH